MSTTYTYFLGLGLQENKNDKLNWDLIVDNWKTLDNEVYSRQTFGINTTLHAAFANMIDVNNLASVGSYQFSSADAAYITHLPTGLAVDSRLDVIELPSDRRQQILRPIGSSPIIYVRNSTSVTSPVESSLIPPMTSTTTPSGEVISSGSYNSLHDWQAFDGTDSHTWSSNSWSDSTNALDEDPDSCYVGYIWDTPQTVSSIKITFSSDTSYTGCIQCRVGGTWQTVIANVTIANTEYSVVEQTFETPIECDAIRFCVLSGSQERFVSTLYGGAVCEFSVYGTNGLTATWGDWYSVGLTVVQ